MDKQTSYEGKKTTPFPPLRGPHENDEDYAERMKVYELLISGDTEDSGLVKKTNENGREKN